MLTRVNARWGKRICFRSYSQHNNNWADGQIILNRDMFKASGILNSNRKFPHESIKPLIYKRSATEFESDYWNFDSTLQELLQLDKEFPFVIDTRFQRINRFLGDNYSFLTSEKTAVLFGLANLSINLEQGHDDNKDFQNSFPKSTQPEFYETERLRSLGESLFQLHLGLSTIFINGKFLTLPANEIDKRTSIFDDKDSVICLFMKRHLLYESIPTYKGINRGVINKSQSPTDKAGLKLRLQDKACVASFYTLLGLLATKFNRKDIVDNVLYTKILRGPSGIVNLFIRKATDQSY